MHPKVGKYPSQQDLGMRVVGMRVNRYDVASDTQEYLAYSKQYGRALASEDMLQQKGFDEFFNAGYALPATVIPAICRKVDAIKAWFERENTQYKFYSSSLLIVYEGDKEENDKLKQRMQQQHGERTSSPLDSLRFPFSNATAFHSPYHPLLGTSGGNHKGAQCAGAEPRVNVIMIDFSHVHGMDECDKSSAPPSTAEPTASVEQMLSVTRDDDYIFGLNMLSKFLQHRYDT